VGIESFLETISAYINIPQGNRKKLKSKFGEGGGWGSSNAQLSFKRVSPGGAGRGRKTASANSRGRDKKPGEFKRKREKR